MIENSKKENLSTIIILFHSKNYRNTYHSDPIIIVVELFIDT